MTFRDVAGAKQSGVDWHVHDGSDVSGDATFLSVKADKIYSGSITGEEIVLAGGTSGIIRSDNFVAGSAGWRVLGDGSAEFSDVTVRGDIISGTSPDLISLVDGVLTVTDGTTTITIDPDAFSGASAGKVAFTGIGETGDAESEGFLSFGINGLALYGPKSSDKGRVYIQSLATDDPTAAATLAWIDTSSVIHTGLVVDFVGEQIQVQGGDVSGPGVSFVGDLDTGMYLRAADSLALAAGGVLQMRTAGAANPGILVPDGTVSRPGLSFDSDSDTGLFRGGTPDVRIAVGGATAARFSASATVLVGAGASTVVNPANAFLLADGALHRSTSSRRYKTNIRPAAIDVDRFFDIVGPVTFNPLQGDDLHLGFIAEDVAEAEPLAAAWLDGRPENINWPAVAAIHHEAIRDLRARVDELEETYAG